MKYLNLIWVGLLLCGGCGTITPEMAETVEAVGGALDAAQTVQSALSPSTVTIPDVAPEQAMDPAPGGMVVDGILVKVIQAPADGMAFFHLADGRVIGWPTMDKVIWNPGEVLKIRGTKLSIAPRGPQVIEMHVLGSSPAE